VSVPGVANFVLAIAFFRRFVVGHGFPSEQRYADYYSAFEDAL
jgi:hypothetical protein